MYRGQIIKSFLHTYSRTGTVAQSWLGTPFSVLELISFDCIHCSKRHETRGAAPGPRSLRRASFFSFFLFCVVFPFCGVNCSGLGRPFSEAVIHGEIFQQSRFHCSKRHETRGAAPGPRSVRRAYLFSLVFCVVSVLFPPYPYVSPPPARARHFRATMRYLAR